MTVFLSCTHYIIMLLLLLLGSPSNTLLECRSNQRICPKADSHVPKCGVPWLPLIESGDEPNGLINYVKAGSDMVFVASASC